MRVNQAHALRYWVCFQNCRPSAVHLFIVTFSYDMLMRTTTLAAIILAFLGLGTTGEKPKTVDEAVQVLKTKWLKPKDLDWILRNPKDQVVWTLYRPFGTGVRNEFGLWGDNAALHESCGDKDPEACSVVILERLWESVRADAAPSLVRQLDCQFQVAQAIHINETGFYKLTTGELVKAIQAQIDDQLSKLGAGTSRCQTSLTLELDGNPDAHCFVDAPHDKRVSDQVKDITLDKALGGLGFFNLFRTVHNPPKITLDFARKCQFPTPPYLFGSPK
jgi:hypothetical protein